MHAPHRVLVERPATAADAALAVDPTPEATLAAEAYRFEAEQLVAGLAASGKQLAADAAQQAVAVDAIVAAAKAVAAEAVADTAAPLAALAPSCAARCPPTPPPPRWPLRCPRRPSSSSCTTRTWRQCWR